MSNDRWQPASVESPKTYVHNLGSDSREHNHFLGDMMLTNCPPNQRRAYLSIPMQVAGAGTPSTGLHSSQQRRNDEPICLLAPCASARAVHARTSTFIWHHVQAPILLLLPALFPRLGLCLSRTVRAVRSMLVPRQRAGPGFTGRPSSSPVHPKHMRDAPTRESQPPA